jgi:hypothetical protein
VAVWEIVFTMRKSERKKNPRGRYTGFKECAGRRPPVASPGRDCHHIWEALITCPTCTDAAISKCYQVFSDMIGYHGERRGKGAVS